MTSTLHLRHIPSTGLIRITPISTFRRSIHQTVPRPQPAAKAEEDENLEQSEGKEHKGAPQPRISNLSMPGVNTSLGLTEEEKEEVRRHNREFEKGFGHSETAPGDARNSETADKVTRRDVPSA